MGNPAPIPAARDSSQALGEPNFDSHAITGFVSLGCGGVLVLEFTRVRLVDVPGPDIQVFEIGPEVESLELEISKDGVNWVKIGSISGGKASVDIQSYVSPGDQFRYVKLKDFRTTCFGEWPGADIDAVVALGCISVNNY